MTTETLDKEPARLAEPFAARWIEKDQAAQRAARSDDRRAVWILPKPGMATRLVRGVEWPSRKRGAVVFVGRPALIPALTHRFERVIYLPQMNGLLPREELKEVLKATDRRDRLIAGAVDKDTQTVTLWRGDLTSLVVPFTAFKPSGDGVRPCWDKFSVTDYGQTLCLGDYEAAADAILYEYDSGFRRRLNQRRRAEDKTLGASIRRLRQQRQLTRDDIPGIDAKTIARIERNEVARPHADTLQAIAKALEVSPDDLGGF